MPSSNSVTFAPSAGGGTWRLRVPYLVLAALAGLVCAHPFPPQVSFDPAFGFLVRNSYLRGAPFNTLRMAAPENLNTDSDTFWAVHSPGQYAVPGLLENAGLRLGASIRVVQAICLVVGLLGYYKLFSFLKFSKAICLASCLVILTNRWVLHNALSYTGGHLFLYAFYPWHVLILTKVFSAPSPLLYLLPLLILAFVFMKLSFMITIVSVFVGVMFSKLRNESFSLRATIPSALLGSVIIALSFLSIQFLYASQFWIRNEIPHDFQVERIASHLIYFASAIVPSAFPIYWLALHLGIPLQANLAPSLVILSVQSVAMLLLSLLSIMMLYAVCRSVKTLLYRELLVASAVIHLVALTLLFASRSLIVEDRHLWPVGSLLLPGLIQLLGHLRPSFVRLWGVGLLLLFATYGIASYGINLQRLAHAGRSTELLVSFPGYSQEVIDRVEVLDKELKQGRSVFFFLDPALGLLVKRNALLVPTGTHAAFDRLYYGKVDNLVIILRTDFVEGIGLSKIIGSFPDMRRWEIGSVGNCILVYGQ